MSIDRKVILQLSDLLPQFQAEGQICSASRYATPRDGVRMGRVQSIISLKSIADSDRVVFAAWLRKHVSHLYNKWDNFVSFSFCSLHYHKRKIRKISVFCQVSQNDQSLMAHMSPSELYGTIKPQLVLPATQSGMWLPSAQAPAMIYHFQMVHLTTNPRSSAFSARSFLSESLCLHMKGLSLLGICLPKLTPIILTAALQVSFVFPVQLKDAVKPKYDRINWLS